MPFALAFPALTQDTRSVLHELHRRPRQRVAVLAVALDDLFELLERPALVAVLDVRHGLTSAWIIRVVVIAVKTKRAPHEVGRALRAGRDGVRTALLQEIAEWASVVRNVEVWARQVEAMLAGV